MQEQVLDSETLLLEYALGRERSYLWAVTPTTIDSYELPKREQIEGLARQAYNLLTEADGEYEQAAASLSEILLRPVVSQLGSKRLVIVADGALNYIPFGALPVPLGREADGEKQPGWKPLVVEHEIINLPSASVLAVLRRETAERKPAPRLFAVLADPVFSPNDERVKVSSSAVPSRTAKATEKQERAVRSPQLAEIQLVRSAQESGATRGGKSLPRLKGTRQEAEAILALMAPEQSKKALDFDANRATATSAELAQYRYVHWATHGLLDSQHPELSAVVLSLVDENGEPVDGFLRLHDIFNLNLPAELVVLSACETGLGKEIRGEGLVGLTRGFMYAGSPRVVVSLWKVEDVATAELMKQFYQGMVESGLRPAAALRAAQVAMWNNTAWHTPYYWAAFTLQGEWQ
jgi:CHAT domain-containing protein